MSAAAVPWPRPGVAVDVRRLAPMLVAATLAGLYVLLSPPSTDLAAALFRAQLFDREGFGLWNNWWYSGHATLSYSVLSSAVSVWLGPRLAAGLAATATAAVFEPLARRHFGPRAWVGATVFGAATAIDLYTGRLTLALGALPALASVAALDAGVVWGAILLATLAALFSPVAALFAALAGAAHATGALLRRRRLRAAGPGIGVTVAALAPLAALALAFPGAGQEPFAFSTLWPLLVLCAGTVAVLPGDAVVLRAGTGLYALGLVVAYLLPTAVGSNAARLGTFLAAPLAALLWWPTHRRRLLVVALPLLYLGWMAPIRDLVSASADPAAALSYYAPLKRFLAAQKGPPFRVEIPFTASHWEAYAVAGRYALARGWERQVDIADNPIFYDGRLTGATYARWLHANAVRFVALPAARLDYSARAEAALIDHGLPYLREVMHSPTWRVYAVARATPIVTGPAVLRTLGGDWLTLQARAPGTITVRVRFTPYWALIRGEGCVAPAGSDTQVRVRRAGPLTLGVRFSLSRLDATAPRCARG